MTYLLKETDVQRCKVFSAAFFPKPWYTHLPGIPWLHCSISCLFDNDTFPGEKKHEKLAPKLSEVVSPSPLMVGQCWLCTPC